MFPLEPIDIESAGKSAEARGGTVSWSDVQEEVSVVPTQHCAHKYLANTMHCLLGSRCHSLAGWATGWEARALVLAKRHEMRGKRTGSWKGRGFVALRQTDSRLA